MFDEVVLCAGEVMSEPVSLADTRVMSAELA
jgi:hypothetical protein